MSEYASVLLKQDILKNEDKSVIFRLTNFQTGREHFIKLLHHIAAHLCTSLVQVIVQYATAEIIADREFPEIAAFIE